MAAEDICDIEKLRRSNDLQWKWFLRTNQYKNNYISWVLELHKNPEIFKKTLRGSYKSAFTKDLKEMFYAAKVENEIISGYMAMIGFVLKKIKHTESQYDELYSIGMIAIRNCIWQYRNIGVKCSFTTYCHNSIWMRIKGERFKGETKFNRRKKYTTISYSTDIGEKFDLESFASKAKDLGIDESSEFMEKLKEKLNLKEDEAYLFECLLNRPNIKRGEGVWYKTYVEKYKHTFPKNKITKEGVRLRTLKLQRKIWHNWHVLQGLPVIEMPKPKMKASL